MRVPIKLVQRNHSLVIPLGTRGPEKMPNLLSFRLWLVYKCPMSILKAIDLWSTTEPYSKFPCATIAWRLLPAHGSAKLHHFWDGSRYRGFVTWAFLTDEEFETRDYCGPEVFAREKGEHLVFIDLIAKGGTSDVLYICRQMQNYFKEVYPHVKSARSHRGSRHGWYPKKGG